MLKHLFCRTSAHRRQKKRGPADQAVQPLAEDVALRGDAVPAQQEQHLGQGADGPPPTEVPEGTSGSPHQDRSVPQQQLCPSAEGTVAGATTAHISQRAHAAVQEMAVTSGAVSGPTTCRNAGMPQRQAAAATRRPASQGEGSRAAGSCAAH